MRCRFAEIGVGSAECWRSLQELTHCLQSGPCTPAKRPQRSTHALTNRRVLTNGYALAYTAVACHVIEPPSESGLASAVSRLQSRGFALTEAAAPPNSDGSSGIGGSFIAISKDGGLLHAATVADLIEVWFTGEYEVG